MAIDNALSWGALCLSYLFRASPSFVVDQCACSVTIADGTTLTHLTDFKNEYECTLASFAISFGGIPTCRHLGDPSSTALLVG